MDFEKKYYEYGGFWDGDFLVDDRNTIRYNTTINLIPKNTKSLLDLGCGNGIFLNKLKEVNNIPKLVGVDRSNNALEYVKTEKYNKDITDTGFDDNSFDCVSALEIIEHLTYDNFENALKEITRISNKYVILSVPFNEKIENSKNQCPQCKSIFNHDLHLRSFSKEYFTSLLDKYGYKLKEFKLEGNQQKFLYHSLYVSLFYPNQKKLRWRSPICPVCGYRSEPIKKKKKEQQKNNVNFLKSWIKFLWPKRDEFYWIIGVFEKL